MADFIAITTQEEFDKRLKERLDRERETAEKRWQDQFNEKESTIKTLQEELSSLKALVNKQKEDRKLDKTTVDDLKKQIAGFELKELKTKTALEHGIPFALAGRLQGATEEEITADAENLSKYLGKAEPIAPLRDQEPHIKSGVDGGYAELARNLLKGE